VTPDERAITFDCAGHKLVGIVSTAPPGAGVGVLIVAGAPQYRVGAHRQFVLLARRLARAGVPAMRFDYRGIGDAAGASQTFLETTPDIAAAIAAFRRVSPSVRKVVLWGLCDGASAALLYQHAKADECVSGMVLVNPWVSSAGGYAQAQVTQSMRRIGTLDFWSKLVRGGIDVPAGARSLASALAKLGKRGRGGDAALSFQAQMLGALENFRGPVLFVLSGRDLISAEFVALCESDARWRAVLERANCEQRTIADADHTFSNSALCDEMEAATVGWITRSFCGNTVALQSTTAIYSLCALLLASDAA
jgi:exosortase A-associated hydrolase 1